MEVYLNRGFEEMLAQLISLGATTCRILSPETAMAIAEAVSTHPFKRNPAVYGPRNVPQCFSSCEEGEIPSNSPVRELSRQLTEVLAGHFPHSAFQEPLCFNDHLLTRYPKDGGMLGAHRDESAYVNLIVSVTLVGHGRFNVHRASAANSKEPEEQPFASFGPSPGSALIMVAPGFCGRGARPFHSIGPIYEERIALVLKQKRSPA